MATPELSAGKTIFVIATVAGCLAILWPRVFQPMSETAFTMTKPKLDDPALPIEPPTRHPSVCCDVVYSYDINNQFFARLCEILVPSSEVPVPFGRKGATKTRTEGKPPPGVIQMCRDKVLELCGTDISHILKEDPNGPKYQKALEELHAQNVTHCLRSHYEKHDKYRQLMEKMRRESKEGVGKHIHQERSPHLHPAMMHPAMRERGVPIAPRMHDHFGQKPKPVPPPMMGVRPPPGVRGKLPTPSPTKAQTGSMGFVMPMYTVGIVVFFIYTVMKFWKMFWKNIQSLVVLFKRSDSKAPQVMDFHMDPEYHKYVLNEEISSSRPYLQRKELEEINSKHSPADDDRKLEKPPAAELTDREQADGGGDEMDVLRSRLEETEATMARIMQQMGCVSDKLSDSWEGPPASPNAEEDGLQSKNQDMKQQEEVPHAPAMQESPSVMNSEQLRDSDQSPKALDDSDLLSLIPEDTRMAVVGMETRPLFDEVPAEEPSEVRPKTPSLPGTPTLRRSRPPTPSLSDAPRDVHSIVLEGRVPAESQFLVAESQCKALKVDESGTEGSGDEGEPQAIVIAGKMTISLLSQANHVESQKSSGPDVPTNNLQETPVVPCNSKNSSPDINSYEMVTKMAVSAKREVTPPNSLQNSSFVVIGGTSDADGAVLPSSAMPADDGFKLISPDDIHVVNMILDDAIVALDSPITPARDSSFENIQLLEGEEDGMKVCSNEPISSLLVNKEEQPIAAEHLISQQKPVSQTHVEVLSAIPHTHQEQSEGSITAQHLKEPDPSNLCQELSHSLKCAATESAKQLELATSSKPAAAGPADQMAKQQHANVHELQKPTTFSSKETKHQTVVIDKDESSEEEDEEEEEEDEDTEEEEEESEEEEEAEVVDKRPKPQPPPPPPPHRDLPSHVQSGKYDSHLRL